MSLSRKSLRGPKTRTLRFETMEDRLYLSAGPYESCGLVQPIANECAAQTDLEARAESEKNMLVFLDFLTEEQKLKYKSEYCLASDSTAQADVSAAPLETASTENVENIHGPQDGNWRNQQAPTILVKKVQDGLVGRDGKVIQDIIFEFERIIDPNDPDAINQSFTTWYSFKKGHGGNATPNSLLKLQDGSYVTSNLRIGLPVETYHWVTFQPGETKAQWVYKVSHDQYLDDKILFLDTVNLHDHYSGAQPSTADTWLRAKVDLAEDWRLPKVNVTRIQNAVVGPDGSVVKQIIFEFSQSCYAEFPIGQDRPLTLNLNYGFSDKNGWVIDNPELYGPFPSDGMVGLKNVMSRSCQVTFQPGERTTRLTFEVTAEDLEVEKRIHLIIADSKPDDAGAVQEYIVGSKRYCNAGVWNTAQQSPHINVKTIQNGTVSPNGQMQQSIIFEFERTIDPDRPESLNQPLTFDYEIHFLQSVETEFSNNIASQADKMLSITFKPGETKARLEFSGFGYNDYKSATSLGVALLGITGYDPEVISENPYAWSDVSLVDNPGEQSIPKVSIKVVPCPIHDDKVIFEIERTVDPNNPHALDETLEITYLDNFGWYMNHGSSRGEAMTLEYRPSKTLVFQPGQSKIILEYSRPSQNRWMSVSLGSPVGGIFEFDENGFRLPPRINTQPDYIVVQGSAKADFETPCSTASTAPMLNVNTIQDGVIDAEGNIVQNPIFEFERVFDPSDAAALSEPLTVNFSFQGIRDLRYGFTFGDYSIQFQPGETKVRFEFDTKALLDSGLNVWEMTCTLGSSQTGDVFDASEHYHVGARFAKLKILEVKPSGKVDEDVVADTTIADTTPPTFSISGPSDNELVEMKTGWWEMSAETSSDRPIMNWEINWGDGSEETRFLGGPRNRVLTSHKFRDPGTYTVSVKTTDLEGRETTTIIGTYVVKAKVLETPTADVLPWNEPEVKESELTLMEVQSAVSFQSVSDNQLAVAGNPAETMRLRQMIDLDQSRSVGQRTNTASFSELIWSDDELFEKEWLGFAKPQEKADFWSEVFVDTLLPLQSDV